MGAAWEKINWKRFYGEQEIMGNVRLNKNNIINFILDCGAKLDEQNISRIGRWMRLPPWVVGLLRKSDIMNFQKAGYSFPWDDGVLGRIEQFILFQDSKLFHMVVYGSVYCIFSNQIIEVEVQEEKPRVPSFDEWNW